MFNKKVWKDGEKIAIDYMEKNGYKILYTNYHAGGVELDIVAVLTKKMQIKKSKANAKNESKKQSLECQKEMNDLLIVCEVKARSTDKYGKGLEAVDEFKKARMIKGAKYLLTKKEFSGFGVRFDVASVDEGVVTYFENAFEA